MKLINCKDLYIVAGILLTVLLSGYSALAVFQPYLHGDRALPLVGTPIAILVTLTGIIITVGTLVVRFLGSELRSPIFSSPRPEDAIRWLLYIAVLGLSIELFFDDFILVAVNSPGLAVVIAIGAIITFKAFLSLINSMEPTDDALSQTLQQIISPGTRETLQNKFSNTKHINKELFDIQKSISSAKTGNELLDARIKRLFGYPSKKPFTQNIESALLLLPYRLGGETSSIDWKVDWNLDHDNKYVATMTCHNGDGASVISEAEFTAYTAPLAILGCVIQREQNTVRCLNGMLKK